MVGKEYHMTDNNIHNEPNIVETRDETDRKCPQCGGIMDFDPNTSGLLCTYCGYKEEIEIDDENSRAAELALETAEETGNRNWGVETKTVICESCGGETVYDVMQTSNECPYCGSNHVMESHDQNTLAPGGVCVFRIDKNRAGQNFHSWIKKKLFCPKEVKQKAKPEGFTGVYLPYWTFDANTTSHYTARYGKNRTVRDKDGKTRTVTDWYPTSGTYYESFNDKLVQGTTRHDKNILSSIEPFDTENNVIYKPEFLAGYASERYTVGIKSAWESAKAAIREYLRGKIRNKILREKFADKVSNLNFKTVYNDVTYKYLLLPVYMSSFKYKGKVYKFMVNGQTGKVGGKTPVSAIRVLIAVGIGLAVLAGIIILIMNS